MCSKHDDPSMIDMLGKEAEEQVDAAWRYYGPSSIELHTADADEYMRYMGDGCDYDCYQRTLVAYPFTTTAIHNWWNHKTLWDEQSEKYAKALRGANEMRQNAAIYLDWSL